MQLHVGARLCTTSPQAFRKTFNLRVIKHATEATAMTESKTVEPTAAATAEPYIGKRELARRLSIKFRTVDSWISRGWIPYYKVGKYVLFKWSEVDAQLSKTCRKAALQ